MNVVRLTRNDLRILIQETVDRLLLENRESKNINLARKFLKSKGYDDEKAQKILDGIRTDIPNSRLGQCKFLLGVVRLYLNNELSNAESIFDINKLLPYIASETHINEYDNNLNDLSLQEIISRFDSVRQQDSEQSRKNSYDKQHTKNANYNIIRIPDFATASKYGKYTSWCVTHSNNMYNNYTNDGGGLFYFCLRKGFENVPKEKGENCPLDEYGLSMIAVSVTIEGEPNTITCRWNHDMGGNDSIMTKDELEDLLGVNFYETFKPYTEDELLSKGKISGTMAVKLLKQGKPADEIFDHVYKFKDGFALVGLNRKYSFINSNGQLIGNGKLWFDYAVDFFDGFARVGLNGKVSFVNSNGQLIGNGKTWFDRAYDFLDGFALVGLNGQYSFINTDGQLIGNGKLWFDDVDEFVDGFACVELNRKYSFVNSDGQLIGNGKAWFDYADDNFNDGFALVGLNGKFSFINTDGQLIGDGKLWFDHVGYFNDGFARVELNGQYSFINTDGQLIGNGKLWFDKAGDFTNGFALVELDGKKMLINTKGEIVVEV